MPAKGARREREDGGPGFESAADRERTLLCKLTRRTAARARSGGESARPWTAPPLASLLYPDATQGSTSSGPPPSLLVRPQVINTDDRRAYTPHARTAPRTPHKGWPIRCDCAWTALHRARTPGGGPLLELPLPPSRFGTRLLINGAPPPGCRQAGSPCRCSRQTRLCASASPAFRKVSQNPRATRLASLASRCKKNACGALPCVMAARVRST